MIIAQLKQKCKCFLLESFGGELSCLFCLPIGFVNALDMENALDVLVGIIEHTDNQYFFKRDGKHGEQQEHDIGIDKCAAEKLIENDTHEQDKAQDFI